MPKETKTETPTFQNVVYLGPDIRGVAKSGTSFTNGIPQELRELLAEHAALSNLIVPHEKFAAARRELEDKNSFLRTIYASLDEKLSEKAGE